jgi:hypothetical protein
MTFADVTASDIGAWVLSAIAITISYLAYRKTLQTDARDRRAIIVIEQVWAQRGSSFVWIPGSDGSPGFDSNPRPKEPDLRLVIVGNPVIADGLILRPEGDAERRDRDEKGNESYRIEFKLENVGRSAATNLRICCTLIGTFLAGEGTEDRAFGDSGFEIPSIPAGQQRFVDIRNMPGIPVILQFDSAKTEEKGQPVRLAGIKSAQFYGRG